MSRVEIQQKYNRKLIKVLRASPEELKAKIIKLRKYYKTRKVAMPPVRITVRRPELMRKYLEDRLEEFRANELRQAPKVKKVKLPYANIQLTENELHDIFVSLGFIAVPAHQVASVTPIAVADIENDNIADDYDVKHITPGPNGYKLQELSSKLAGSGGELAPIDVDNDLPVMGVSAPVYNIPRGPQFNDGEEPNWVPDWDTQLKPTIEKRLLKLTDKYEAPYVRVKASFYLSEEDSRFLDTSKYTGAKPNGMHQSTHYFQVPRNKIPEYLDGVKKWLTLYDFFCRKGFVTYNATGDKQFIYYLLKHLSLQTKGTITARSTITRVAKCKLENCVISVIRYHIGKQTDEVYKKFPYLRPAEFIPTEDTQTLPPLEWTEWYAQHGDVLLKKVPMPDIFLCEQHEMDEYMEWDKRRQQALAQPLIRSDIFSAGEKEWDVWQSIDEYEKKKDLSIYVNEQEIHAIARLLKLEVRVFSALGVVLGAGVSDKWASFGVSKKKVISVKIQNEHATIVPGKLKVRRIEYHDKLVLPNTVDVVDKMRIDDDDINSPLKFYTQVTNGELVMHKTFRPSKIVPEYSDDDVELAYLFRLEELLFWKFKKDHNLTVMPNDEIRAVVRASEHFIGRRVYEQLDRKQTYTEIDQNKNYCAYETSKYYRGFPTNDLYPCKLEFAKNPAFFVVYNINFNGSLIERPFKEFYTTTSRLQGFHASEEYNEFMTPFSDFVFERTTIVLARPTYDCLIANGVTMDVAYVLDGEYQHISIINYTDQFNITLNEVKDFRNSLIGRTITGGIREKKIKKIEFSNKEEREQLIYEAQQHNFSFGGDVNCETGIISVEMPTKPKGLFNFHTFILAYAATHVMEKWVELMRDKYEIVAYNVDAVIVKGAYTKSDGIDEIGGWKTANPKPYYYGIRPRADDIPSMVDLPVVRIQKSKPLENNTVIISAGGLGKSYGFKVDPPYDQIICAPTHELCAEHRVMYPDTYTVHKTFQLNVEDDKKFEMMRKVGIALRPHSHYTIDEGGMSTTEQWEIIIRRAGNARIATTIDFEQINNSINGTAVTRKFFEDRGWNIIEITRTPEMHARHEYSYGIELDKLRGLSYQEQCDLIRASPLWAQIGMEDLISDYMKTDLTNTKMIIGTHEYAYAFHCLARQYATKHNLLFPFVSTAKVTAKRPRKYEMLPVDTPNVFWERKSMKSVAPPKTKWEPYFAVTADAYQGKTAPDGTTLIIHMENLERPGSLYTAMTRTRTAAQIRIYNSKL